MLVQQIKNCLLPIHLPGEQLERLKSAAVLVPVVKTHNDDWQIIFTRRAEHLRHHPGQISFPGGSYEQSDIDLCYTAVRETQEETGIDNNQIQLLGRLPQQQTISRFFITPYVGLIDPAYETAIDTNEVAEIFTVPFSFLADVANHQQITKVINGTRYNYYVVQYKDYNIWGATANILVNFIQQLNIQEPPVA